MKIKRNSSSQKGPAEHFLEEATDEQYSGTTKGEHHAEA
jgi:hypothetical protein